MSEWIFKIIYYPIFAVMVMCATTILGFMFKEVGWEQPFRWLCIIGLIAYAADYYVNKQ